MVIPCARISLIGSCQFRPFDPDLRIIPCQSPLISGMIEISTLIAELRDLRENQEPVGEAFRNIELFMIVLGQDLTIPFSVCAASLSQIHRHIKNTAADHTHQLSLRVLLLKMKTAQHSLHGGGLVVLYKYHVEAGFVHIIPVICLHKITAPVPMDRVLDHIQSLDRCLRNLYLSHKRSLLIFLSPPDISLTRPASREAPGIRSP